MRVSGEQQVTLDGVKVTFKGGISQGTVSRGTLRAGATRDTDRRDPVADAIDAFFDGYTPEVVKLARATRRLVRKLAPDAEEKLFRGWKVVAYGHTNRFCAIAPHKQHVNLQVHSGAALDDAADLLEGTGKSMRHVKLLTAADLKQRGLTPLIRQAARQAQ